MATSPSRVNSGTDPISRRYSRAGSQIQVGIIGLDFGWFRFRSGFAFFQACARGLGAGYVLIHGNAVALKGRQHFFDFVRRMHFGWQQLVHLIIEQVAPLFAQGD
jgi:hypothetical protein